MIPVLSVAPAPQTTATTPLSITTSTETSRQYPRGQRRQSNLWSSHAGTFIAAEHPSQLGCG
jgi:hypothetical protein